MFDTAKRDIQSIFDRDPAARSLAEVLFCYPGLHALYSHRIAHWLWRHHLRFFGRMLSHISRFFTGIEIHPAARIGPGFFIDHGMGVVIGETAEIGENVTMYHGVTLGGTSWKREKRHPTIGNNVIIGAGAKVLGPIRVGDGSRIGSGSVVLKDVPPNSVVVGVPGRVTFREGKRVEEMIGLDPHDLPDPVLQAIHCILDRMQDLDRKIDEVREQQRSLPVG